MKLFMTLTKEEVDFINQIKNKNKEKASQLTTAVEWLVKPIIDDLSWKEACICVVIYWRVWNDILTCWSDMVLSWVNLSHHDRADLESLTNKLLLYN